MGLVSGPEPQLPSRPQCLSCTRATPALPLLQGEGPSTRDVLQKPELLLGFYFFIVNNECHT